MDKKNNKCLKQIDILLTKTVIGIFSMLMLFWELDHVSDIISKNTKK